MKVTVERAELLKSLGHVHRVVERRNTIPILANVLVRAEKSALSLKATDLDLEVIESIAAEVAPAGVHHRARAHVLRDRAQAPRGLAGGAGILQRPRRAGDPRRALALHPADAAGERFPRPRRRRHDAQVHARRRRPEAPDRQDPVRDLDRGDALLSQRHLSARRGLRQNRRRCARSRPTATGSPRPICRCRPAPPACPASSCRARP